MNAGRAFIPPDPSNRILRRGSAPTAGGAESGRRAGRRTLRSMPPPPATVVLTAADARAGTLRAGVLLPAGADPVTLELVAPGGAPGRSPRTPASAPSRTRRWRPITPRPARPPATDY